MPPPRVIPGLAPGVRSEVTPLSARKRNLIARLVVVGVSWLLLVPGVGRGQACADPHYRWSEKVDTTLETRPVTPVDIAIPDPPGSGTPPAAGSKGPAH